MAEFYRSEISTILRRIAALNKDLFSAHTKRERTFILEELEVAYFELSDAISDYRSELAEV